jgi:hypothetical protein
VVAQLDASGAGRDGVKKPNLETVIILAATIALAWGAFLGVFARMPGS